MPTYVMDDGCVFHTIKGAIEGNLSSGDICDYENSISNIRTLVESEFEKKCIFLMTMLIMV